MIRELCFTFNVRQVLESKINLNQAHANGVTFFGSVTCYISLLSYDMRKCLGCKFLLRIGWSMGPLFFLFPYVGLFNRNLYGNTLQIEVT